MKKTIYFGALSLLFTLACVVAGSAQSIAGVWQITSETTTGDGGKTRQITQPSMYVFTKKHYSLIWVTSDTERPAIDSAAASAEDLRSVYVDNFVANAGTYDLGSGKLSMWPAVAKNPTVMHGGSYFTYRVKITRNTMTMISVESQGYPVKNPTTLTFKRVE